MPKDSSDGEDKQVNADEKPKKNQLVALGKSVGQKIGYLLPTMVARNQSYGSSRTYPSSDESSQYSGKSAKLTKATSYKKLDDLSADQDVSEAIDHEREENDGYQSDPPTKMAARFCCYFLFHPLDSRSKVQE
ncbi:MAG: hypothetical protein MK137_09055 [Rickettsiales bacterium]|nr:hypothetical protein [Rickettsiales bacterium]